MAAAAAALPKPILLLSGANASTAISRSSLPHLPTRRSSTTTCSSADRRVPALAATLRLYGARVARPLRTLIHSCAAASPSVASAAEGMSDPDLRLVLELATDEELMEIEEILYSASYFSPLLKSVGKRPNSDSVVILGDIEERDMFISKLESRFLYLAADASDHPKGDVSFPWGKQKSSKENSSFGVNEFKGVTDAAWRIEAKGLESAFLKGGSASIAKRLSGKMLVEVANYEIKKEIIKQGGRLAAINLKLRAGMLAARQGLARAASRYVGLRSLVTFLGPIMWGTLLADIVIQMLGTDYTRIALAIYTFAQSA